MTKMARSELYWKRRKESLDYTGSEFELHKFVVQLLRLTARPGVIHYAVPNGEHRSPRTGARLKAQGVLPGVADLVIISEGGQAYHLELKRADGRLSPDQRAFEATCAALGAPYAVARTPDEARAILAGWGVLRAETHVGRSRTLESLPTNDGDAGSVPVGANNNRREA